MSIEQLRREVELQERRVAILREKKTRRLAVLSQVRELMKAPDEESFVACSAELWRLLREAVVGPVENSENHNGEAVVCRTSMDLFTKEMDERIMNEEEPHLKEEWEYGKELEAVRRKSRRSKARKRFNEDGGMPARSAGEESSRSALLQAVDALQLPGTPRPLTGTPSWLCDTELGEPGGNEERRDEEEQEYSDDFDEASDVESVNVTC
uniref:Uncharacterized protein n=1 Tax=Trypanosoma congolense (strain IL3000) TaxID=1068625 RepID=G0UTS2_TRYCI|nr:conserved hypothetical protein [Trypanosoma congolense IL3000]